MGMMMMMYSNFSLVAADQLFAQIGKLRYLYGNTVDLRLTSMRITNVLLGRVMPLRVCNLSVFVKNSCFLRKA